jgi:tRNA(Ile)-lysidine synthase
MTNRPGDNLLGALAAAWPPQRWRDRGAVLAVSGGADSVALLRAAVSLGAGGAGRLTVAHFNHRLRPDADADEQFVVALAAELGLPCEVGRADVAQHAAATGEGLEAAARAIRYEFLRETSERLGARYVATGHTADDQAETVLHRVLRGRLRLLSPAVTLVRPLLDVRRREVLEYLGRLGQAYCVDPTNADRSLTRNRIRHELLPLLAQQYNPEVTEALLRLSRLAADNQRVIDRLAEELFEAVVRLPPDGTVAVDCGPLAVVDRHLVREL